MSRIPPQDDKKEDDFEEEVEHALEKLADSSLSAPEKQTLLRQLAGLLKTLLEKLKTAGKEQAAKLKGLLMLVGKVMRPEKKKSGKNNKTKAEQQSEATVASTNKSTERIMAARTAGAARGQVAAAQRAAKGARGARAPRPKGQDVEAESFAQRLEEQREKGPQGRGR